MHRLVAVGLCRANTTSRQFAVPDELKLPRLSFGDGNTLCYHATRIYLFRLLLIDFTSHFMSYILPKQSYAWHSGHRLIQRRKFVVIETVNRREPRCRFKGQGRHTRHDILACWFKTRHPYLNAYSIWRIYTPRFMKLNNFICFSIDWLLHFAIEEAFPCYIVYGAITGHKLQSNYFDFDYRHLLLLFIIHWHLKVRVVIFREYLWVPMKSILCRYWRCKFQNFNTKMILQLLFSLLKLLPTGHCYWLQFLSF